MSDETPGPGSLLDARLDELLALLRADPPLPPPGLATEILQAARFERGVRSTSRSLGDLGASVIEGIVVLLGLREHRGRC